LTSAESMLAEQIAKMSLL